VFNAGFYKSLFIGLLSQQLLSLPKDKETFIFAFIDDMNRSSNSSNYDVLFRESLLKGKAQYSLPPHTHLFR
jgi:hypothetical protein